MNEELNGNLLILRCVLVLASIPWFWWLFVMIWKSRRQFLLEWKLRSRRMKP